MWIHQYTNQESYFKQRCAMVESILETLQNETNNPRRQQVELFLHEEENLSLEGSDSEYNRIDGNGNNTIEQRRLGLDIDMIGAREEKLGRTRSQTQEMFSPRNESMERAELTMEKWIQETCLIPAVTSGPAEPKTFKEAWYSPIEKQ